MSFRLRTADWHHYAVNLPLLRRPVDAVESLRKVPGIVATTFFGPDVSAVVLQHHQRHDLLRKRFRRGA